MKKLNTTLAMSLLFWLCISGYAQVSETVHAVGKNYSLNSKVLNAERHFQVYLPQGYQESTERSYPVMYVLDGQEYFLHPIAYQDMLRFRDKSPDFIVVGINTDRRLRRTLFYEKADDFISFLQSELIPFIDNAFRTKKEEERIFFGWEMAGGLGVQICAEQPNFFSAFFLASSTHITKERIAALGNRLKEGLSSRKYFHLTRAPDEGFLKKSLASLDSLFQSDSSGNIEWTYLTLAGEDHYTTPTKSIHDGLSNYFADYKPIRFYSLKEYDDFGGLSALRAYYKNRGKRFSVDTDIHRETKHFLLLNAMNENNLDRFEYYNRELGNYVETQVRRDFWVKRYADFYITQNQPDKALSVYRAGLQKFPESAMIYNSLGHLYTERGEKSQAKTHFGKALEIATEKKDSQLENYRQDLLDLR
ncbi:MAG: alpha/beta hydrolase-fold protein [Calditrichia bacterium]